MLICLWGALVRRKERFKWILQLFLPRPQNMFASLPGFRMWSQQGFWTADERVGSVKECPAPRNERCKGWDREKAQSRCGSGYRGSLCSSCSDGYYQKLDVCEICPDDSGSVVCKWNEKPAFVSCSFSSYVWRTSENVLKAQQQQSHSAIFSFLLACNRSVWWSWSPSRCSSLQSSTPAFSTAK